MKFMTWLAVAAGAVALGSAAQPAQAAPTGGPLNALNAAETGNVQQAHWRGRGYRYGYGPRYGYRGYGYGPRYGYRGYGYRPGLRFYFGPRYHRYGW